MLVVSIEQLKFSKKKNRYKVRLIDGADFILYAREIDRYNIVENEELSEDVYKRIIDEVFIPRAKARALHLLEKQDRTEKNLRDKLKESGYPKEAVDVAIEYVSDYNYINDLRYAQNYIKYRRDKKSRRRIERELINKGIKKEIIEEAIFLLEEDMEDLLFDELSVIEKYIEKKLSSDFDEKKKQRVYAHLMREGFSSQDIISVLNRY